MGVRTYPRVVDGTFTSPAILAHATPGDVPPALTVPRLFTSWEFDPWLAAGVLLAGAAYLYGVRRLRARGDSWSHWRTLAFVGPGLGSVLFATQSFLGVYDAVLLSTHMVQHMILSMIAPVFLALGAPVTLALRTLRPAPRRALVAVLHSRVAKVLSFPLVAGVLFVASPFALYFTGWYEATLRNGYLHEMLHVHFLIVGCLWFWPIVGVDPVPGRMSYPLRMLAVFTTLPFHAWLGVAIMSSSEVIAEDWYLSLQRDWGASLLSDQRTAGGILWASGDLVGLLLFGVLFVQWMLASEREAEREDRRLDRLEAAARARQGTQADR
jgi:cytochrome c oxidase assembly factor CtaG